VTKRTAARLTRARPSCATTRQPGPSWLASGPRARAHGRPSAAWSATWRESCFARCCVVPSLSPWRL